jgi:nitrous oxide reductase accessory protein NosL
MSFKITHKTSAQALPFPNREAAEAYAEEHGGGLDNWTVSMTRVPVVLSPHHETRPSAGARTPR